MSKPSFSVIGRDRFAESADALYDMLYTNMHEIAPTGNSREADRILWQDAIAKALENPNRQIVLIRQNEMLVGFFMFCLTETTLKMEEIQFLPSVQGTGLFRALYVYLFSLLPKEPETVEAFAHKTNGKSQGILRHFGLSVVGENKSGSAFCFRGDYRTFRAAFAHTGSFSDSTTKNSSLSEWT